MHHEGKRLDDEIKRKERELEQPISAKRRIELQAAINHLLRKKRERGQPH
jgi:hypothetical protein